MGDGKMLRERKQNEGALIENKIRGERNEGFAVTEDQYPNCVCLQEPDKSA